MHTRKLWIGVSGLVVACALAALLWLRLAPEPPPPEARVAFGVGARGGDHAGVVHRGDEMVRVGQREGEAPGGVSQHRRLAGAQDIAKGTRAAAAA